MFPIRDHNPSSTTPFITYLLIAANVLIFLSYGHELQPDGMPMVFHDFAMYPSRVADGRATHTLVTSMFLHAGWLHLAGNMLFLWIFGDNMEDAFGHIGFLLFYLACGVGAGLAHVVFEPWADIPTVGASGAIAGVLGGYLLLYPRARVDVVLFFLVFFKTIQVPAYVTLGLWFLLQIYGGVTIDTSGGGVAYWAHIGGFAFGLAFTAPLWMRRGGVQMWRELQGRPKGKPVEDRFSKSDVPTVRRRR